MTAIAYGITGAEQALVPTSVMTSAYTAAVGDLVLCNTSAGGFTVKLPNAPANGTRVGVIVTAAAQGNLLEVECQGSDTLAYPSGATLLTVTGLGSVATFAYQSGTWYAGGISQPPVVLPGDPTGATDAARIQAAINITGSAALQPGATYYFGAASAVTLGAGQSLYGNWATVEIAAAITASQAFLLNGNASFITDVVFQGATTATASNPVCDAVVVSQAGARVGRLRAQYVNGWIVRTAAGAVSCADTMIESVTGRNSAAGVKLQGASGSSYLGELFLGNIQLQEMGVSSGANANLDALLIQDCGDIVGTGVNIGFATGMTGRAIHISGACATVKLDNVDAGSNAISGGSPAIHIDAATGNGTPSDVRINGTAQGGTYACEVDAGTDILLDLRLHQAYASGLKVTGTPSVTFRGICTSNNQGGNTLAYDVDGSGLTSGGVLRCKGATFETSVGSASAGVIPNVAAVTSQCYFEACDFAGSGTTPSTVFSGTPEIVINCPGYNPRGSVSAPTVSTSPYTPSTYQAPLRVIFTAINGMSAFAIGGTSVPLPAAGAPYYVGVRESMTVTWSGTAPTWQWLAN